MRSTLIIIAAIILSLSMGSCNGRQPNEMADTTKKDAAIVAQTFKTDDGWGYTVFVNDKLFIKQSFIPVIAGNKGFAKEDDAIKVASLVVNKLQHHQKPTIRLDELQQAGIVSR